MPYADSDGVRIHYQLEGAGPPLVLQHGFSDSLRTWYEQGYVDALKRDRQLILVDARGHGASDKPHDTAAYAMELMVADIIAVLRDLDIPRADYFGYSMGGRIGFAIAQHAPERFRCLILGGAAGDSQSRIGDGFRIGLKKNGAAGIPALWGAALPATLAARLVENDIVALDACRIDSKGFAAVLPAMSMPCLVYVGTADPRFALVEATVAEMPNARFFTVQGLGHAEVMLQSELVLPRILEFLNAQY